MEGLSCLTKFKVFRNQGPNAGVELVIGNFSFKLLGKNGVRPEMATELQGVDVDDILADFGAAARQADVGELRLGAGMGAAREIDAQGEADFGKGFFHGCGELLQAKLQ